MTRAQVQQRLAELGYRPGPIDGLNGPATRAAVRAFQAANGLFVDGIPGPATQAALLQASLPAPVTEAGRLITVDRLRRFAPGCPAAAQAAAMLQAAADRYGIDTPREVRHWMATLHVESLGFTRLEESLSYSAARLCVVWPKRFPTLASGAPFAHNPVALANKVYGSRGGNRAGTNDGWDFRGSGPPQLTFHDNFAEASEAIGVDLVGQPDLARTWEHGCTVAGWFFHARGLSGILEPEPGERLFETLARTVSENEFDDVRDGRQVWNGGTNGLHEVEAQLLRAAEVGWR